MNGAFSWQGGTMSGASPGRTLLASAPPGTLREINAPGDVLLEGSRVLENQGQLDWQAGRILLRGVFDGVEPPRIDNYGTLSAHGNDNLHAHSPLGEPVPARLVNKPGGTLTKVGGGTDGVSEIAVPFLNDGTTAASLGTLRLAAGAQGSGDFGGDADSFVRFGAGLFDFAGANVTGRVELVDGAAITGTGLLTVDDNGELFWRGGTMSGEQPGGRCSRPARAWR